MATKPDMLTADDVLDMPFSEGLIGYELMDGKPVPVTSASRIHGRLMA